MARARNLKPSFFTNDALAECEPLTRLLFAGLWTIADREGRLEDRPKRIKAEVMPYDEFDCDAALTQLAKLGFIKRYSSGGINCIEITNFLKHQNPHKQERESELPGPESETTSNESCATSEVVQKLPEQHQPSSEVVQKLPEAVEKKSEVVGLNPSSLNPDSLSPSPEPNHPSPGESVSRKKPKPKSRQGPPGLAEWKAIYPKPGAPVAVEKAYVAALKDISKTEDVDDEEAARLLLEWTRLRVSAFSNREERFIQDPKNWLKDGGYRLPLNSSALQVSIRWGRTPGRNHDRSNRANSRPAIQDCFRKSNGRSSADCCSTLTHLTLSSNKCHPVTSATINAKSSTISWCSCTVQGCQERSTTSFQE